MTRSTFSKLAFAVLALAFLIQPASADARAPSYKKTLKKWTRGAELYQRDDFHASLTWDVSWITNDLLEAQARKYGKVYEVDESVQQEKLAEWQAHHGGGAVFLVSFYSYERREKDLSRESSVWKLKLDANGRELTPVKIEKINRKDSLLKLFYPFVNLWTHQYYVYFPEGSLSSSDKLMLSINGPTGKGKLYWNRKKKK